MQALGKEGKEKGEREGEGAATARRAEDGENVKGDWRTNNEVSEQ